MDRGLIIFSVLIIAAFFALMQASQTGEVVAPREIRESRFRELGNVTLVEGAIEHLRLE